MRHLNDIVNKNIIMAGNIILGLVVGGVIILT